jgi:hypothetical protein
VKIYEKYGRKPSWIVKRYVNYGWKLSWIVKWYENMEETQVEYRIDMENTEEKYVE